MARSHVTVMALLGTLTLPVAMETDAAAATLAEWSFGTDAAQTFNATTVAAGLSASAVTHNTQTDATKFLTLTGTATNGTTGVAASPVLKVSGKHVFANLVAGTTVDDIDAGTTVDYWSVELSSGTPFDVDDLSFDYAEVSANRGWKVSYSTDGWSTHTDLGTKWTGSWSSGVLFEKYTFSINESGITELEVRWFTATNNVSHLDSGSREVRFDNISLTGTAIPEPASIALLGTGCVLALRRRRSLLAM